MTPSSKRLALGMALITAAAPELPRASAQEIVARERSLGAAVLLVATERGDAGEAAALVRAEIAAAGFRVVDLPGAGVAPASAADARARREGAFATVRPIFAPKGVGAEILVQGDSAGAVDRYSLDLGAYHAGAEEERARLANRLAVRVVELLRARAIELHIIAPQPPPAGAPSAAAAQTAGKATPPQTAGDALAWEIAAATGRSLAELGMVFGPSVRASWRLGRAFEVGGRVAVFAFARDLSNELGRVSATPSLALAEGGYQRALGRQAALRATLGLGFQGTFFSGDAEPPRVGHTGVIWSPAFDGGVALLVSLSTYLSLVVDGHALVLAPPPTIEVVKQPVARGAPVAFHAGLGLRLGPRP